MLSASDGCVGATYEVRETIMYEGSRRKKTFMVFLMRDSCDIVCSCHLFEFRGILCRHAITVLDRNDVTHIPEKYILRRWRRDIPRAHTRVAVNYDGLVSTPAQLRYEEMCNSFAEVANLIADDEQRSRLIMEWIKVQRKELMITKSSARNNPVSQTIAHVEDQCTDLPNTANVSTLDPKSTRRKGAPRKLRRKSLLEIASKKAKTGSTSSTCRRPRASQTNISDGGINVEPPQQQQQCVSTPMTFSIPQHSIPMPFSVSQHLLAAHFIYPISANFMYTSQGDCMPLYYPSLPDEDRRGS